MDLQALKFFQFENLIKNRIPFALINLGVDLSQFYQGHHQTHLNSVQIMSNCENVSTQLESLKIDKSFAVVVICIDGIESSLVTKELEAQGYINSYYIAGGLRGLLLEKES